MKDSVIFYKSFYEIIKELPDKSQLELYNAIFKKYFYGEEIELKGLSKGIFGMIVPNIDSANKRYFANVENGKKGGRPKKQIETQHKPINNPLETQLKPKQNLNDNDNVNVKDNDNIIKEKNIKKEKYGQYGRVKLTINEYLKLRDEFGEDFIKRQIDLLDEYIQSNNNKNKYSDFNLVLRKSIRENWFKNKGGSNNIFLDIMKEEYGK